MTVVGSVGNEITRVDRWLQATLTGSLTIVGQLGDGTDGVHADVAAPGAKFPLIVHQFQGGADVRGSGPFRIMLNGLWVVKVVGETRDFLDLEPIDDAVDALLQGTSGAAGDGLVLSSVREYPLKYVERENNHDYRHLGGAYRILAQIPSA